MYDLETWRRARNWTPPLGEQYGSAGAALAGGPETGMRPERIPDLPPLRPGERDRSGVPELGPGRYAGRGPRIDRRDEARTTEDVCEALTAHPEGDPGDVEVRVEDNVVRLTGTVEDRRAKRLAADIAASVVGVCDVLTELRGGAAERLAA